jgi:protein SCO1/2
MKGKKLLLVVLLALPILTATLLYLSNNHYELPEISLEEAKKELTVYNPKTGACPGNEIDGVHRIPDFSFIDQDSNVFTNDNLSGDIHIANFFFTRCPGICLTMTEQMRRVAEVYGDAEDVQIIGYSVDPEFDTPDKLRNYQVKKKADYSNWTMLTGDQKEIYRLAHCGYFIPAGPNPDVENDFVHSDKFMLIDKNGRIRGFYSGTDPKDVDRLIIETELLRNEG